MTWIHGPTFLPGAAIQSLRQSVSRTSREATPAPLAVFVFHTASACMHESELRLKWCLAEPPRRCTLFFVCTSSVRSRWLSLSLTAREWSPSSPAARERPGPIATCLVVPNAQSASAPTSATRTTLAQRQQGSHSSKTSSTTCSKIIVKSPSSPMPTFSSAPSSLSWPFRCTAQCIRAVQACCHE
jgi:hypothetical protein